MKIKEISVGNYVRVNYGLGEGQIFKVERIVNNKEGGWVDLHNKEMDEDYSLGHFIKELDPVYIKDVIDKLGFERVTNGGFDYYEIYSDEFIDVTIEEYTDGLYLVNVSNNEFSFPTECKLLSSIHELQNFLTMCNADLKIEL